MTVRKQEQDTMMVRKKVYKFIVRFFFLKATHSKTRPSKDERNITKEREADEPLRT